MAIAQGGCPNCGAPIEFALGASLAKVCEYCRHTVVRSDRGLEQLGKVADLAETPALIAVGDEGSLSGRQFRVMGRVQLDHGKGPWDEYYVAFDYGQSWGYLAYAQGQWLVTTPVPGIAVPAYEALRPELDVVLGNAGTFRVAEVKSGRIVSAEGELGGVFALGSQRFYADLWGKNRAFATIDYGDRSRPPEVFLGWAFPETAMSLVALGPRSANKVRATTLKCPSCGGDVPALAPDRSERLGCPYCGAVSDIAERRVISVQQVERSKPVIPIGSKGTLDGVEYLCLATVRRGSDFEMNPLAVDLTRPQHSELLEGELYVWEEFLLWNQGLGFRWLVLDPETGWSFVNWLNPADLDLSEMPRAVKLEGRRYTRRNSNVARVTYVLGEVYWKCEIGETTRVMDFVHGERVLSREEGAGEVHWSQSSPLSWPAVAGAFQLPLAKHARAARGNATGGSSWAFLVVVILALIVCGVMASALDGGAVGSAIGSPGIFRGGGIYSGGK